MTIVIGNMPARVKKTSVAHLCVGAPQTGPNGGHASSSAIASPKVLQFQEHRSGANCDGGDAIPEAFRCLGLDYSIVRSSLGRTRPVRPILHCHRDGYCSWWRPNSRSRLGLLNWVVAETARPVGLPGITCPACNRW